jgi:hypothetical protein
LFFPDTKNGMAITWLYEKLENGSLPGMFFKELNRQNGVLKV